jgi:hypothetical protein
MKWLSRLITVLLGLASVGAVKQFFDKYTLLIFDKEDLGETQEDFNAMDLRGNPTHACICGSAVWNVRAVFDNYEIATYFLDMECAQCGSLATAPTPLDREGLEN